jgi:hypothetical protein
MTLTKPERAEIVFQLTRIADAVTVMALERKTAAQPIRKGLLKRITNREQSE